MTFQPTAWILVFATLFVGFSEQGCKKDGGGGAAASKQGGPSGNGTKTDGGERVDLQDGSETPEPPKRDDRIDGKKVGRWITGKLLSPDESDLQTMTGKITEEKCAETCSLWCPCNGAVWVGTGTGNGTCQIIMADKVTVDEVPEIESTEDGNRRMLQYHVPVTTTPAPLTRVWIKNRCDVGIRDTKVAAVQGFSIERTEFKDEGGEMTAPNCTASCGRFSGCKASEATTTTETVTTAGPYATAEKKTSTECYHVTGQGIHLTHRQSVATNDSATAAPGEGATAALFVSATTCRPREECTSNMLEGYVFADFYNASASLEVQIDNITTAKKCKEACDEHQECEAAVFVQERETQKALACWRTPRNDTYLVHWNSTGSEYMSDAMLYFGYLQDEYRPDFEVNSSPRASPSDGPAVGAIIGGALAAVAVAVLAFVGFRAYKKHKGADAENTAETGSVATSSPKSARKRQAIE